MSGNRELTGNNRNIRRRAGYVLFAICIALIVYYGLVSDSPLPYHHWVDGINDLLLHVAAFGVLTFLVLLLWPGRWSILLLLFVCGVGIELVHLYRPDRTFSLGDVWANMGGIIAGVAIWWLYRIVHGVCAMSSDEASRTERSKTGARPE